MVENNPEIEAPEEESTNQAALRKQRWIVAAVVFIGVILVAGIAIAIFFMVKNPSTTSNLRDIFIILMAFESLIIGAALVVLIIQIASLINLLQNEVKPILLSTNETVNTLRGTTEFLSENLVEPVIKLNSYLAGLKRLFAMFGANRK